MSNTEGFSFTQAEEAQRTPDDQFRGSYFKRDAPSSRTILEAAKRWAKFQHHKLQLMMEGDDRSDRDEDPDTWAETQEQK